MKSSEAMILAVIIYCRGVEKRKNSAPLYTIAKTAFIIARIIAFPDFTSAVQYRIILFHIYIISSIC